MIRYNNLYEKIISIENLNLADLKARKNKNSKSNMREIRKHDRNREANIKLLHKQLKDKSFNPTPYKKFKIYEPKERTIYVSPYYPDRIVHHAIMNVMEPIWKSIFIEQTYACIKGRGVHLGSKKLFNEISKRESEYYLQIDIKKFYPSVNHDILIEVLKKKIKDKELLWLLEEIIKIEKGLPIGTYLSQYFANLYLAYFDHFAKRHLKIKVYSRYMDDIVIVHESKETLWTYFNAIKEYLQNELKLEIKNNYRVAPVRCGIDYLGYVHYPTHVLLRKRIKKSIAKAYKRQDAISIASYHGWAKHANSKNLIKKLQEKYGKITHNSYPTSCN